MHPKKAYLFGFDQLHHPPPIQPLHLRQVAAPPVAAPSLAPPVRTVRELEGALNSRGTLPASPEEGVEVGEVVGVEVRCTANFEAIESVSVWFCCFFLWLVLRSCCELFFCTCFFGVIAFLRARLLARIVLELFGVVFHPRSWSCSKYSNALSLLTKAPKNLQRQKLPDPAVVMRWVYLFVASIFCGGIYVIYGML